MLVPELIHNNKIVAIIRGADPADVLQIARALQKGGITLVEVTLNSPSALKVIEELRNKIGDEMTIGAGTVLDAASVNDAVSAGARFIISPCVIREVIDTTKKHGAVSIPGAFTPTEIVSAYSAGADIVKVFPANGVQYIKDIRAPLSHIPLMPTGGINLENIATFFQAGAVAVGIGTALVDTKQKITPEYLVELTNRAARFVDAINQDQ